MKARILRITKVHELSNNIAENLERYRTGDFEFLKVDPSCFIELAHEIDEVKLSSIACGEKDHKEIENCIILYEAMGALTPYLARDLRIWTYLVHAELLEYSRSRWPIPDDDEKAVKYIRTHYFINGARGFERDNSASRLWWMAALCSRVDHLSLEEALSCFLFDYDTRAGIIERPTTSQSRTVFSSIIRKLHKVYQKDSSLINRYNFRPAMRKFNLVGGFKLLGALDQNDVEKIFEDCLGIPTD